MSSLLITLPQAPVSYSIDYSSSFDLLWRALRDEQRSFAMITDQNVFEKSAFFSPFRSNIPHWLLVLPAGEEHKRWETIQMILHHFFEVGLDRSSVVFAVGGGVIGDMVGFASSIFMRGIPFIQVPTTVLSMVDSSVGGKTGIDTEYGKNLIGTFHQPEHVMIAKPFLSSLPFEEIQNGLAEMVKHAIISGDSFEELEQFAEKYKEEFSNAQYTPALAQELFSLIQTSVHVKKQIVEEDEKEQGKRAWLNLGHTFGHAIELLSDFSVPHGLAVAKGTILALQTARDYKWLEEEDLLIRTHSLFHNLHMNTECLFSWAELLPAMMHDKKKSNGALRFVLPKKRGEMMVVKYNMASNSFVK